MKWSPQQQKALDTVGRWLKSGTKDQQCLRMFGWAGTGKTTLAKFLSQEAGHVVFGAYTGKAASVLRDKGCIGATTIHQMIYLPADRSRKRLRQLEEEHHELSVRMSDNPEYLNTGDLLEQLNKQIEEERDKLKQPFFILNDESPIREADLIVIDEVSMVGQKMGADLLSFKVPVLVLGDPAQLGPIKGTGFFTDQDPDILLTEIHRQARDNPIIQLATMARKGQDIPVGVYGESEVMDRRPVKEEMLGCDQVLVGTHKTRNWCNRRFRSLLGYGEGWEPVIGDKLVCLKNDHLIGFMNGTVWIATSVEIVPNYNRMALGVCPEGGKGGEVVVEAHVQYFQGEEPPFFEIREAQAFDYGYALTCHKSQGSEWDHLVVLDESRYFKQFKKNWLYTAITRSSSKLKLFKNFSR